MVFFDGPIPCDQPVLSAVRLALDMCRDFERLNERWTRLGYDLGFGLGIASGYATMGILRALASGLGAISGLGSHRRSSSP